MTWNSLTTAATMLRNVPVGELFLVCGASETIDAAAFSGDGLRMCVRRSFSNPSSRWTSLVCCLAFGLAARLASSAPSPADPPGTNTTPRLAEPTTPPRDVAAELELIRAAHHLPALGAVVVLSNRVVALGVTGVRKAGETNLVTASDQWHHGSITKSMTATLAAMLVEEGRIAWTTRIADVFPDLKMTPQWKAVTLEQLLSHHAGAPADLNPSGIWARVWLQSGPPHEQRRFLLEQVTALPPEAAPGTKYIYSNAGYAIAGALLEKVTDQAWEDLITKRLFQPLGMTSAGFGAPGTPDRLDQPRGHTFVDDKPRAVEPGRSADNPVGIGPAGIVHCSLMDLAKFAAFHLAGEKGNGRLLKPESFKKLHTGLVPLGSSGDDHYAMGWIVTSRDWAGGTALTHTGSNTMWFTTVWLAPKKDFAVITVTNIGGDQAAKATDEAAWKLIQEMLLKK
jgi:CubicO group peptidase (beta-lactamase class C family)